MKSITQAGSCLPIEAPVSRSPTPRKIEAPRLLNVGCGSRSHPAWINLDLRPCHDGVMRHDVLRAALPFADDALDAVYHSHVLEHLPRARAVDFLRECRRVLKPGGTLRVAAPNFEEIARLYLNDVENAWRGDAEARERHAWLLLETIDQAARERSGGEMIPYLLQASPRAQWFVSQRLGAEARSILQVLEQRPALPDGSLGWKPLLKRVFTTCREWLLRRLLGGEYELLQVGRFRRHGEVHHWLVDRVAMRDLLTAAGFSHIRLVEAEESAIPGWRRFHLDTDPDGAVAKPDSLFIEASKG